MQGLSFSKIIYTRLKFYSVTVQCEIVINTKYSNNNSNFKGTSTWTI